MLATGIPTFHACPPHQTTGIELCENIGEDFHSLMLIERLSVIEVFWQITFSSNLNN